jgi:hypothetical protein
MARAALSDGVILRSPIFSVEFEGRDEAMDVLEAVYEALGEVSYLYDEPGDPAVFVWKSDIDGEPVEGADLVRYDDDGKVTEVTVFLRPLRGIAAFLDKTGPILAEKRGKHPLKFRLLAPPPSMMMRSLAALGPKMLGLRRAKK